MENSHIESSYPKNFRFDDAKLLGEHIRVRHSVELVGMTRVGISNFLRFFLYHKEVIKTYVNGGERHIFVSVDLNDLVELGLPQFWNLTFRRFSEAAKVREISDLFLKSEKSRDLFFILENLRKAISLLVSSGVLPTIFFIRFDRLKEVVSEDLFAGLLSLIESSGQKLAFVFTGSRSLDQISPAVFPRKSLLIFSHLMYIKPAKREDIKIIFETFEKKYQLEASVKILDRLIELSAGHVQYLQLGLIILNEQQKKDQKSLLECLQKQIFDDERIILQSEEIWDSLTKNEQEILKKMINNQRVTDEERQSSRYLSDTMMVVEKNGVNCIFSPLFDYYLRNNMRSDNSQVEMTKKESKLFNFLLENKDSVCEREKIITAIWPEEEEMGVSDWTIDRLVSRLRNKLKLQNSQYSVTTVKTRGYKLN